MGRGRAGAYPGDSNPELVSAPLGRPRPSGQQREPDPSVRAAARVSPGLEQRDVLVLGGTRAGAPLAGAWTVWKLQAPLPWLDHGAPAERGEDCGPDA